MNKKRFIISIIFVILGIQNNIMGVNSLGIQRVKNHYIESHKPKINKNQNVNLFVEDYQKYHSKMNYNQHLSDKKYYLMMVGNCLNIISSIFLTSCLLELIIYKSKKLETLGWILYIITIIISTIITIILLKDFYEYKKAKNSNDINQYKKYIIDDNNINQLTKQRRYNFINGLSIGSSLFILLIICITKNILKQTIKDIGKLFKKTFKFKRISDLLFDIGFILIITLSIIYIIFLIKDNKKNIWNSIKNSIHKQDILFHIGYSLFIFIGFIGLYYLSKFLYTKEQEESRKDFLEKKNIDNKYIT